jgi:ribosomal protein L23
MRQKGREAKLGKDVRSIFRVQVESVRTLVLVIELLRELVTKFCAK